ncbi:MAG: hypothetical protein JOZ49_10180, partial [Mycolicibacterium sp.]|nr:hypothetical protein [Mycolicibacterium sp.]
MSESVAAQLSAHNVWVAGLSAHSALLRAEGGLATQNTSLNLAGGDQDVARRFGGIGSGDGMPVGPDDVIVGPPAGGVAVEPVMPEIPELTAPPVMTGEQVSQLLRGGPGPSAFQDFASHMRSRAGDLRDLAGRVHRIGLAVDDHWRDGGQQAGANIVEHGDWITDLAGYSDGVADAADQHAGHLQSAIDQSPHPQEFVDTRNKWQQAVIDNAKAGGLLSGRVSAIAAHHADLERRGTEAGQVYFAAATTTSGDMPEPPRPAPPIVKSAPPKPPEDGKPGTSDEKRTKFQSSDVDAQQLIPHDGGSGSDVPTPGTGAPPNPDGSTGGPIGPTVNPPIAPATPSGVVPAGTAPAAAPAMDPNAAGQAANIAGTIVGSGLGTLSQLAHGLMPSGGSGMASAPLSALSGLSGLPSMGSPSMPGDGMPGGLPGGMPSDPGLGSPDLGTGGPDDTTSPAGGGDFGGAGGGGDAGGGGGA